jgi:UDP-glucose 4-epimerase
VRQAVTGADVTVFGDGTQTRCFAHVDDTIRALLVLMDSDEAVGRVLNVGNDQEISILQLAQRVIARAGSPSEVCFVPYDEAYDEGFEELGKRKPNAAALTALTGWEPRLTVDNAIDDVIAHERDRLGESPAVAA